MLVVRDKTIKSAEKVTSSIRKAQLDLLAFAVIFRLMTGYRQRSSVFGFVRKVAVEISKRSVIRCLIWGDNDRFTVILSRG